MKAQTLIQCNYCGKWFITESKKDITGISMILEDGTQVNACYECVCKMGTKEINPLDYKVGE